jgi:hypothetical protein
LIRVGSELLHERAEIDAFTALIKAVPSTLAGLLAWAFYLDDLAKREAWMFENFEGAAVMPIATFADALGRLAVAPVRWPEVDDGELVEAHQRIISLDAKISEFCDTISDDDRYTHQGYLEAEDARFEAIDRLSEISARSWKGIKAKASALNMRQILDDVERARSRGIVSG